jgi:hypothetical protein
MHRSDDRVDQPPVLGGADLQSVQTFALLALYDDGHLA